MDRAAMRIANMLANGMGGFDWSGLPIACAYHGIDDIDALLMRLYIIKTHRKPGVD